MKNSEVFVKHNCLHIFINLKMNSQQFLKLGEFYYGLVTFCPYKHFKLILTRADLRKVVGTTNQIEREDEKMEIKIPRDKNSPKRWCME